MPVYAHYPLIHFHNIIWILYNPNKSFSRFPCPPFLPPFNELFEMLFMLRVQVCVEVFVDFLINDFFFIKLSTAYFQMHIEITWRRESNSAKRTVFFFIGGKTRFWVKEQWLRFFKIQFDRHEARQNPNRKFDGEKKTAQNLNYRDFVRQVRANACLDGGKFPVWVGKMCLVKKIKAFRDSGSSSSRFFSEIVLFLD